MTEVPSRRRGGGERHRLRRARWQLTAWYVVTFSAILVVLGGLMFERLTAQIGSQLDASLDAAATTLAHAAAAAPAGQDGTAVINAVRVTLERDLGRELYVLERDGASVGPDSAPLWIRQAARTAATSGVVVSVHEVSESLTLRAASRPFRSPDGHSLIAIATANQVEWEDENAWLVTTFAGAAAVALLLVGAGGFLLARRAMVPIEETFEYMRRFMADAAHELRTPLTVLRTRVEFALRQPRGADADAATLRELASDADRLGHIVEDLLTLARADAGEQRPELVRVFLDDAAQAGASAAAVVARARGVELQVQQFDEAIVNGDAERLRQLAVILLDNAIKFTAPGGTVSVRVGTERGLAFLAVEDTGVGILATDLPRVFDRFYRGDPARSPELLAGDQRGGSGVGLGLSIARWIADLHGAEIHIDSKVGSGTTVTVWFPATVPQSP